MTAVAPLLIPPISFGNGSTSTLPNAIVELGGRRPLILSGSSLERLGVLERIKEQLTSHNLPFETYIGVEPEPSTQNVMTCVNFARSTQCDVVVGLGGGSVMDTAKAVAMLMCGDEDLEDYLNGSRTPTRSVPTIMMPTTSGTGSEVGRGALFFVPERRAKEAVFHDVLLPAKAIIDPVLTHTLPPEITAATGIDALCHAVESFTGRNATPLSEPFSTAAIKNISSSLRQAVWSGDPDAREQMALGSLQAGIAIANAGTNAVHALAYPLQGLNRITHGVANAVLLPYVMEYVLVGNVRKFAEIAALTGCRTSHLSMRDAAEMSVAAVRQLMVDIGLPQTLGEIGITEAQLPDMVNGAMAVTRLLINSPRRLNFTDIETIFREAM